MEATEDVGVVTATEGKSITVEITKGGGCKSCSMKGLCGTNVSTVVLKFDTEETYNLGDKVRVSVSSGIRVLSSLLVFGLPLLALFGFFLIGRSFTSEPVAVLIGFVGLLLAFGFIRLLDKRIAGKIQFHLEGKYEDLP
jgi:positive regulator of sigma E activity